MGGIIRSTALVAALAALATATPVFAQSTGSGTAAADIVGASRIQKDADLRFGTIIPGIAGGTITVAPGGAISTTGSVTRSGGGAGPAAFSFDRRIFRDYPTYSGPGGGDQINLVNPAAPGRPMRLRNFTTDFSQAAYFFSTNYTFHVGGTLDVASDQPSGVYSGTFTVILDNF